LERFFLMDDMSLQSESFLTRKWPSLVIAAVLAFVLFWIAFRIAKANDYMLNGDFFSFWLAGRMVDVGEHPYDEALWTTNHERYKAIWTSDETFLYPLPLSLIFAPLGILDLRQAAVIWVFLSLVMILISVALLISLWRVEGLHRYILPVIAGVFTFRPVLVTLRNGQLGAFLLFSLALVVYLWQRGEWILGGLLLPILILKPSIGLPIVAVMIFWLLVQRRWMVLGAMSASALALAISGWLFDPTWMRIYLSIGGNKFIDAFGYSPTVWGMAHRICGESWGCTIGYGAGVAVMLISLCLWIIFRLGDKLPPWSVGALGVSVSLLVAPYLWAYDQILLIFPVLVSTGCLISRGKPYLLCASLPILMSAFSLILIFAALKIGYDIWSGLLSMVALFLVILLCGGQLDQGRLLEESPLR
jgi:hypothetical protein